MEGLDFDSGIDLEQLGLPISNTENKLLEAEIQHKEKEIYAYQKKVNEYKDRVQAINDHLKNVRQELQHTQALLEARKRDVETEDHMKQIAEREEGRLKMELKRLNLERDDLNEKRNIYENNLYVTKQKKEEIKSRMKWDQQALEVWLEESARQDEDAFTIAKYARADETKIKELSLKMDHLHEIIAKKKKFLDNEMIETMTAQIELDKTAEDFRRSHEEREELINQWEKTIRQMKKRDEDMDKCANELAQLKIEIMERDNLIKEKQEFLDNEKENNMEMDKKLNSSERLSAKTRLECQAMETARIQMKDELQTLKYTVDRVATDLETARGQSVHLSKDIKDKRKKLETLVKQRELMQLELKKTSQKALSSEEHGHQVDKLLTEEEYSIERQERDLENLRKKQFAHAQNFFDLKRKEASMNAEIMGGRASFRNLSSKQHKLDEELLKQQEILYTQGFQLQQLQHKLGRMEGERSGEELEILNKQLKELEIDWERQSAEEGLIQNQLKRVQEDIRCINREREKGSKKKLILEDKIDEMNLHIDVTQRELKRVITSKQDKMVDENIVKLEVKRLRDHLYAHNDEVQSLEKRKLQLNTAMSERMQEIAVHKSMLKAQIKSCDSERQTISLELHEHIASIDKLRNRYEIVSISMNPPEGEGQYSQAYYVIKAAQEREELQRHGDSLDAQIRKAEKEIRAMENTLHLMNSKNTSYRKSLTKVESSSDEMEELMTVEGRWRTAQDRLKLKKNDIRQMTGDTKVMNRNLTSLKAEKLKLSSDLEEKQNTLATLTKEMDELKAKQDRVSLQTTKLIKELKGKEKVCQHDPAHIQKDIELRELRDFGVSIVQKLGTLASKNPELVSTMQVMFSQAGLPPPPDTPSGSRASSVPSSARSSTTSGRSSSSRTSSTLTTPIQTTSLDIGVDVTSTSTPGSGSSQSSFKPGKGHLSKTSLTSSRQSSRPPSHVSSSSQASSTSSGSKKDLDLTIGPSPSPR